MKTTLTGSEKVNQNEVKNNIRPNITGKEKNENNSNHVPQTNEKMPEADPAKSAEVKTGANPANEGKEPVNAAPATEPVKPEPSKIELKEQLTRKPVFNLDTTVKLVGELSKKITQRDKFKATIDNLDTFKVAANENGDVTESNKFYRCELVIHDDEGNEFVTKNAYIIDQVAQFVNSLCVEKLAEIEAGIVIPA